jgi:hypothetical protein
LASKNTNPLASLASVFPPLTDNFYIILGQLFSDYFLTTRQFGECLKKTYPHHWFVYAMLLFTLNFPALLAASQTSL